MTTAIPTIYSIDEVGGQATFGDIERAMHTTAPCRVSGCTTEASCSIVTNSSGNAKNLCPRHTNIFLASAKPGTLSRMRAMGIIREPQSVYACPTNLRRYNLNDFGGFVTDAA